MGISLRHHVLSLVAIFLMLLVGLLVGVGLSSQPELTARIRDLTQEFEKLMTEIAGLRKDAAAQERFAQAALPDLVSHKLAGRQIVLIVTARPPNNRVSSDVTQALEAAGAQVPYRVVLRTDFAERAAGAQAVSADACDRETRRLAEAVAKADEKGLRELERLRLIHLEGRPSGKPPAGVVVLGGGNQAPEEAVKGIDRALIEALLAAGVGAVVGCEPRNVVSNTDTYRDLEASTVDNVDLVRGRASLVLALSGKPGHYGDGPSAEQEFAPLE